MLETNTLKYTHSPTDSTGLYAFVDLSVLVLQGRSIEFIYRQSAQTGKVQSANRLGRKLSVSMSCRQFKVVCPCLQCIWIISAVGSSLDFSEMSIIVVSGEYFTGPSNKK